MHIRIHAIDRHERRYGLDGREAKPTADVEWGQGGVELDEYE